MIINAAILTLTMFATFSIMCLVKLDELKKINSCIKEDIDTSIKLENRTLQESREIEIEKKQRILEKQCKKYGIKLETVEIKNKRLLFLIQQIDRFANEKEINEVENILKDFYLNLEPDKPYLPKFSDIDDENVKNQIKELLEKGISKFEKENS